MSRKRQAKKRKKRKPVKKQSFAVSGDLFREASGILMDKINEMTNERLYPVRNRGGSGAELARETLISRDPGLAMGLRDDTIHGAVESYFRGERTYGEIEGWDVSNVTNMYGMFFECGEFNSDLSGWDVSRVTNMNCMFFGCTKFNANLSAWDVSNVKDMDCIFNGCGEFNSDLSGWDVRNVIYMYCMFYECGEFNSDLSGWDVSNVAATQLMFYRCNEMIETNKPIFT